MAAYDLFWDLIIRDFITEDNPVSLTSLLHGPPQMLYHIKLHIKYWPGFGCQMILDGSLLDIKFSLQRVVSKMILISIIFVCFKFHNKSWASKCSKGSLKKTLIYLGVTCMVDYTWIWLRSVFF